MRNSKLRNIVFKTLSIRNINRLRKIKWFFLNYFINDVNSIKDFYSTEIEIRVLEKLIPKLISNPDPILLDIGANIGGYSSYLSNFIFKYNGKCIGFEPRKDTWLRLVRNVSASNFHAERYACSSNNGYADIYLPPSHGQSSLIKMPEFEGLKTERIQTITLDTYCEANNLKNILFIKIDVEGHEFEVLNGAKLTIETNKPIILCESENRYLNVQNKTTEKLIEMILYFDYSAYVISRESKDLISVNEIKIPKDIKSTGEYYFNYWFVPNNITSQICPIIKSILEEF
jgi:FkbM family methyltransferase